MKFFDDKLEKLQLKQYVAMQLPVDTEAFKNEFQDKVMAGNPNFHFSYSELFSSNKKDFVGYVHDNSFTIRRRRQLLDFSVVYAKAVGCYQFTDDKLEIKVEIKALYALVLMYWIVGAIGLLGYLFVSFELAVIIKELTALWYWLVLFMVCVYWFPYILMRNSITHLKIAIQQELIALI